MTPQHFNTGNSSELQAEIPITGKGQPYKRFDIYSYELTNIKTGDILLVTAQGQVTNGVNRGTIFPCYNAMVAQQVCLVGDVTTEITEGGGTNVTPDMHHYKWQEVGTYKFLSDYNYVRLCVRMWSASSKAKSGDVLRIDRDYGSLSGILFRQ